MSTRRWPPAGPVRMFLSVACEQIADRMDLPYESRLRRFARWCAFGWPYA